VRAEEIFTIGASITFLGLAALVAFRGAKNPLAFPLALLCVDLFAYNSLEALGSVSGSPTWEWLEAIAAALAAPLLIHFALAFLGARREQRLLLRGAYAYFGAVAASCLSPFFAPGLAHYPGGELWAMLMLVGLVPSFGWVAVLLFQHYRTSRNPEERARTQLFIGTIVIGVGGPATDLIAIAGAPSTPELAALGMLVSALVLTALALRSRLLSGTLSLLTVNALVVGVVGAAAHLLVFRWVGSDTTALVIGTVAVTLVLLGAARAVWSAFTTFRERSTQLVTLGRLSAQMAHDIRNPLAAIRGAAQYLDTERERGGRLEDHREFLELILEQTERLERVVSDYQRLGRAQPVRAAVDAEKLVHRVVDGARVSEKAAGAGVKVTADIALEEPTCHVDPDLVAAALENLVRNAIEAIAEQPSDGPRGGLVRVEARRRFVDGRDALIVRVIDDGPGMDARTREQAEEAFFTTKGQGTGLGLAFARRVAEAHGGSLRIATTLGSGTTVTLTVPSEGGAR
jgi:signal transduction histidine kinase